MRKHNENLRYLKSDQTKWILIWDSAAEMYVQYFESGGKEMFVPNTWSRQSYEDFLRVYPSYVLKSQDEAKEFIKNVLKKNPCKILKKMEDAYVERRKVLQA